jgi:VanZ family protein
MPFGKILCLAGFAGIVAIFVLSVVPGPARPHVLPSGSSEHFFAYALTALTLLAGCGQGVRGVTIAAIVTVYAGLLEILQAVVPGRQSQWEDFAASAVGVWGALILFFLIKLGREFLVGRSRHLDYQQHGVTKKSEE